MFKIYKKKPYIFQFQWPPSDVAPEGGVPYHVTYPMMHLILPIPLSDRQMPVKYYLSATSFVGGKNLIYFHASFKDIFSITHWNLNFKIPLLEHQTIYKQDGIGNKFFWYDKELV